MAQIQDTVLFNDANLVSYYKLESTADSKGSNTLTNNNSVTFAAAKYSNGADYGSANSTKWLSKAGNLGIAGNSDLTVAFWIKLGAEIASGTYTLFELLSITTADRYIVLNYNYNGGTIQLDANASAGTHAIYTVSLGTSVFHHIALVRNVAGNVLTLYVDGVSVATGTVGTDTDGNNNFSLGASRAGLRFLSGIQDDIGVFSRILTGAEISNLATDPGTTTSTSTSTTTTSTSSSTTTTSTSTSTTTTSTSTTTTSTSSSTTTSSSTSTSTTTTSTSTTTTSTSTTTTSTSTTTTSTTTSFPYKFEVDSSLDSGSDQMSFYVDDGTKYE